MTKQAAAILSFGMRTGGRERWKGALRDFRVYRRRLCADEIAQLYGLVGHWKLDEKSGAAAADSSGAAHDGTVIGTPTWSVGTIDGALRLNGSSFMNAGGLMGNPRNVTLAAWANLTLADTGGAEVISLGDYFSIRLNEGMISKASFYNGSTWANVAVNQTFRPGWHHFAAVFHDDQNVARFYIDGVEAASVATTSSISYSGLGSSLRLGTHGNGASAYDFTGKIDDARIYNRALCPTEIEQLYSQGDGFAGVRIINWIEIQ
jgi:hypothetical protein